MKVKSQVVNGRRQVSRRNLSVSGTFNLQPSTFNLVGAFTLIELLVVITILGILAALTVPALKNLGKSNAATSASQQMLDDIGYARQLAINNHTTVYMVFVTTNFWNVSGSFPNTWWQNLTVNQQGSVTNLLDKQLSGYTYVANGSLGDQPGQHQWHYLSPWRGLPQGFIIAPWKFSYPTQPFQFIGPPALNTPANNFSIYQFDYTNNIPFPPADSNIVVAANFPSLPYIAFNYQGQLISSANDSDVMGKGFDIPLAQGYVSYGLNPATKIASLNPASPPPPTPVAESPPGNSTNISYNVIHIDWLTGRATLEFAK